MPAAKFKEQCLAVLDSLPEEGLIVTKHGKPVAKIMPVESSVSKYIGSMKGKVKIKGDILSTGIQWDAES